MKINKICHAVTLSVTLWWREEPYCFPVYCHHMRRHRYSLPLKIRFARSRWTAAWCQWHPSARRSGFQSPFGKWIGVCPRGTWCRLQIHAVQVQRFQLSWPGLSDSSGVTGIEVFGSLCMNRVHGDKVNVFAAEKAVATTGIFVVVSGCRHRMPFTRTSAITARKRVPVVDDNGRVLSEVVRVMEICAEGEYHFRNGALFARGEHHAGSESPWGGCEKVCRDSCQFRYLENDARPD